VVAQKGGETPNTFSKRVYNTIYVLSRTCKEQQETRVVRKNPETYMKRMWNNLHEAWKAETVTAVWYVIQVIIPTNLRLQDIRLADTPNCKECGGLDTRLHRLIEWGRMEHLVTDQATDRVDHADDRGADLGGMVAAAALSDLAATTE
jgi:hypothetical protein